MNNSRFLPRTFHPERKFAFGSFLKLMPTVLCLLLITPSTTIGQYPPLPVPPQFAGPSCEPGQIMLDGVVRKVSLFHGTGDAELDWHVYMDLHPNVTQALHNYLSSQPRNYALFTQAGCLDDDNCNLKNIYSEIMVIDNSRLDPVNFADATSPQFRSFFSADVTSAFRLTQPGLPPSPSLLSPTQFGNCENRVFNLHTGRHPAFDLGLIAICDKSDSHDLSMFSQLIRLTDRRVYLQGAFVEDADHRACVNPLPGYKNCAHTDIQNVVRTRPEIHPLDSIAFAMEEGDNILSAKLNEEGWPSSFVKWRVATFANSGHHRINNEPYLKKARTTTWYLALPQDAYSGWNDEHITMRVNEERLPLWNVADNKTYFERGVGSYNWELANDPKDGRRKLMITVTMNQPDNLGGIVVRDYTVTVRLHSYPDLCIRNSKTGYGDCQSKPWAEADQTIDAGKTAIYYVRGQNQGPVPMEFVFRSFPAAGSWNVKFFDATIGGNDITNQVTGNEGWRSPTIPGNSSTKEIRVEVTPGSRLQPGAKKEVVVQAVSSIEPANADYVKAITKVGARQLP